MFSYLNKIGSLLDEIDGSKVEGTQAEAGDDGPPPPEEAVLAEGSGWQNLLASASSAGASLGSAASSLAAAKARDALSSLIEATQETFCHPNMKMERH
eukprot:g16773.t1